MTAQSSILIRIRYLGILFLFIFLFDHLNCQVRYQDSLRDVIATTSMDQEKLNALIMLGLERNSLHADSLNKYAYEAQKLAIALHDKESFLETLVMQGHVWNKRGESKIGIAISEREIEKAYSTYGLRHKQRKFYLLKGFILNVINKPREAQETFFTVLEKAENEGDLYMQAAGLNGIGWSFQNLNNIPDAIKWYKKGLAIMHDISITTRVNKELMAVLHSNIGMAYYPLFKKFPNNTFADSARLYLDSAINTSRQNDFTGILAISLGTKALLISDQGGDAIDAENMLQEAISIRKSLGQLYFIIADMTKLGELYFQSHDFKKSITACKEAIRLADSSGIKSDIILLYEMLARSYRAAGQFKEYGDILAVQIRIQDSINKANTIASLNELNARYEVQKKETLIVKQQYYLLRRTIFVYIIIIFTITVISIAIFKFRKLQKAQKNKLAQIAEEEKIKLDIERKIAQEKERVRITEDLHDDVGATLSSLNIYGDLAHSIWEDDPEKSKEIVGKIAGQSRELMFRMSDIIWSMKPELNENGSLTPRIRNFAQELLSSKGIDVDFQIDETIFGSISNPMLRKNIILIIKEALNNVAKYSKASKSLILLEKRDDMIYLEITDNGMGFVKDLEKKGNGLENMATRTKQMNGVFDIISKSGAGVTISCQIPIATIS